jgi:CTP synthase (UTP-ammonia lyase)
VSEPALRIALVGDRDDSVPAHRAIPLALRLAARDLATSVEPTWLPTETIDEQRFAADAYDAVWCVPASPYRGTAGALRAIRSARELGVPFLGTCGGFQHAVLEYARNLLGLAGAAHAELEPDAELLVVTPLECALVEARGAVRFAAGSRLARAYGAEGTVAEYHCRYGLAPGVRERLEANGLRVTATDDAHDARAVELDAHPFYVATLFQPERTALRGETPPLARALVEAAAHHASRRTAT